MDYNPGAEDAISVNPELTTLETKKNKYNKSTIVAREERA